MKKNTLIFLLCCMMFFSCIFNEEPDHYVDFVVVNNTTETIKINLIGINFVRWQSTIRVGQSTKGYGDYPVHLQGIDPPKFYGFNSKGDSFAIHFVESNTCISYTPTARDLQTPRNMFHSASYSIKKTGEKSHGSKYYTATYTFDTTDLKLAKPCP